MDEEDLFHAYAVKFSEKTVEQIDREQAQAARKLYSQGWVKCSVPGCVTQIAVGTGTICRFHRRPRGSQNPHRSSQ